MLRRQTKATVRGPYYDKKRHRWQVHVVGSDGETAVGTYSSEEEANQAAEQAKASNPENPLTAREAFDKYEVYLRSLKKRPRTLDKKRTSVRMLIDLDMPLKSITAEYLERQVERRLTQVGSPWTAAGDLSSTKTWLRWCKKKKWVTRELIWDLADVKVDTSDLDVGKEQLGKDEARNYTEAAIAMIEAEPDNHGPVVALLPLWCAITGREIFERKVRDLDNDGTELIIRRGKTKRRKRTVDIPPFLVPVMKHHADDRDPFELLFPGAKGDPHFNSYGEDWVRRVCEAAGVPVVCPHGLRGTHATFGEQEICRSPSDMAVMLGHGSTQITLRHYTLPSARTKGKQRRMFAVMQGGRSG